MAATTITQSPEIRYQKLVFYARKFLALLEKEWDGEKTAGEQTQLVHKRTGHLPKSHREWSGGVYSLVEAKVDLAKLLEEEQPDEEELRQVFGNLRNRIPM